MLNKKRLEQFFNIAYKRHNIYKKKESGEKKPWTDDPIFQNYYFCNVFRHLDKTSVWIINNVIKPNEYNPELWKSIVLCRYVNKIETLTLLLPYLCWNGQALYSVLRKLQSEKTSIFNSAFIVNSKGQSGIWEDKVTYIFNLLKRMNNLESIVQGESLQKTFETLRELSGVGNFMAYQYTMDFAYCKQYLKHAEDELTWTKLGLGAIRGMNRLLYNTPERTKIINELELSRFILNEWNKNIEKRKIDFPSLKICDVQHQLCEMDKYLRGGSKKRRYKGI